MQLFLSRILLVLLATLASAEAALSDAGSVAAPPGMHAITLEDAVKHWAGLSPRQQLAALEQIIALGELELAERLIDAAQFSGEVAADGEAMRAAIRLRQARPQEAAQIAEKVVAHYPKHRLARLTLGQAKFQTEDDAAARENLELAVQGINNPQVETAIRQFIDAIDARKRWSAQVTIGGLASTNISQGTDTRIVYLNGLPFVLDGEALGTSGAAIWTGLSAGYVHALSSGLDLVGGVNVTAKRVSEERLHDTFVGISIGPRWSFNAGATAMQIGLYATTSYRWIADEAYAGDFGGRLALALRPGEADLINLSVSLSDKSFARDWRDSDLSYQDGDNLDVGGTLDHVLSAGRFLRLIGGVQRERTETRHLSFDHWRAGGGLGFALTDGISAYAQGLYSALIFKGDSPGTNGPREDARYDASLQVDAPRYAICGFVPSLQYTYTRNASNVAFYDFDAHGVGLTITGDY